MKISSLASIVAAVLSAGGAIGGYLLLKPSTLEAYLKWKGFELAGATDEGLWKSIYSENKEKFSSFFGTVDGDDTDKWKEIKKYCVDALKKSDYSVHIDKATNFCVDNVKTVSGQLIRKGKSLEGMMKDIEQFKVATAFQANEQFWSLLEATDKNLNDKATAYKSWCEESLKAKPSTDLVDNVDIFCRKKPYSNFEQKLASDGYERLNEKDIQGKYDELKIGSLAKFTGSNLLEIIGGGSEKWAPSFNLDDTWKIEKSKFEEVYKKYCDEGDSKKFDEDDYLDSYSNYRGICAKPLLKR